MLQTYPNTQEEVFCWFVSFCCHVGSLFSVPRRATGVLETEYNMWIFSSQEDFVPKGMRWNEQLPNSQIRGLGEIGDRYLVWHYIPSYYLRLY